MITLNNFTQLSSTLFELPRSYRKDMRAPARIYITKKMLEKTLDERSVEQLVNMATLPGIDRYALAMPDIHQGYGFPIGGVAAIRTKDGVISPGGVGYDVNCGIRLLASPFHKQEIQKEITALANQIKRDIPSGVGHGGSIKLNIRELDEVLQKGVRWAVKKGFGSKEDIEVIEENGCFEAAEAQVVPTRAKERGGDQLGTLGSGNHFLEIQEVVQIFDEDIAKTYGLFLGQVTVMIHTGSRGLGHEICTYYVRLMNNVRDRYKIILPDRELVCAPFQSKEGQLYFRAMAAAANFAWTNRQVITHRIREAWRRVLKKPIELAIVYDVAHNIAKMEKHGKEEYIVHRKGATRAFPPNHPAIPSQYQMSGQPVLIPGSMGTYSYVLAGTYDAMKQTFGSCCHGAGRAMSRIKAKTSINYQKLLQELEQYGVVVCADSKMGILEEAPLAYKNVDEVIEVVSQSGIGRKVAKLKPLAVIKG